MNESIWEQIKESSGAIWRFITCRHKRKGNLTLTLVDDDGRKRTAVVGHECLDCGRMWGIQ